MKFLENLKAGFKWFFNLISKAVGGDKASIVKLILILAAITLCVVFIVNYLPLILSFGAILMLIFADNIQNWTAAKEPQQPAFSVRIGEHSSGSPIDPDIVRKRFVELKQNFRVFHIAGVNETANNICYRFDAIPKSEVDHEFILLCKTICRGILRQYFEFQGIYNIDVNPLVAINIKPEGLFVVFAKNTAGIDEIKDINNNMQKTYEPPLLHDEDIEEDWRDLW